MLTYQIEVTHQARPPHFIPYAKKKHAVTAFEYWRNEEYNISVKMYSVDTVSLVKVLLRS